MSIVSFVIIAGLVLMVRDAVDASHFVTRFVPQLFLFGVLAHAATLALNALRLEYSLTINRSVQTRPGFANMLDLMVLHNFLVSFLPARLADGYYPLLLSRRSKISIGAGIGNLILIRVYDVMAIAAILAVLAPLVFGATELRHIYFLVCPLLIVLATLAARLDRALAILMALTVRPARRITWLRRVLRIANQARHWIRNLSVGQRVILAAVSLVPWTASGFTYLFVMEAIGLDLSWIQAMLAGKLAELGAAVPIQAAGGVGAGEGLLATVLVGFGIHIGVAVVAALCVRVLILGIVAALFVLRVVIVLAVNRTPRSKRSLFSVLFGPDPILD